MAMAQRHGKYLTRSWQFLPISDQITVTVGLLVDNMLKNMNK